MKVLENGRTCYDLNMLEMLHIQKEDNPINLKTDVENLNTLYACLVLKSSEEVCKQQTKRQLRTK
ncbi:CLUMA_CG006288, isoform A [Clunio marinus]|uniref:CLUMA_CG006288, isoform A n=1 Tax=Clunio marinus TaxID=568069 RepID=A0A1J1HZH2_9DIPT|nr:CLUMA_CG006288, isoform A [Clunio marinus]